MYTTIERQEDFEVFFNSVNWFHDSILRELSLVSRGYVDVDRKMWGDCEPSDLRLILQTQSDKAPCVEIIFEDVNLCSFLPDNIIEPSGTLKDGTIIFYLNKNTSPTAIAKHMKYRILSNKYLGKNLITIKNIPIGELKPLIKIERNWGQCPSCLEAWEYNPELDTTICPNCGLACVVK